MGNIVLLDEYTINKIAAGEVVDRPASIVKELVENSIDAGATSICVEIKNGGISYINIKDNGSGIKKDDVEMAFERHATSKIRKEEDIGNIKSMGFRGEALASVAGISKVTLTTKHKDESVGTRIVIEGGNVKGISEVAYNTGTNITVQNVFYNVPARYKFLKKDYTEAGYIEDVITRIALANPQIGFKYISNNKEIIKTNSNSDITTVIYNVFGKNASENCIKVDFEYEDIKVIGVVGKPVLSRSTRQGEYTYINTRYVKNKAMEKAIEGGFEQSLGIGKFPFAVVNVTIEPNKIDVNVHPAKLEVKFEDEGQLYKAVYFAVKNSVKSYEEEQSPFKQIVENSPFDMGEKLDVIQYNIQDFNGETKEIKQEIHEEKLTENTDSIQYIKNQDVNVSGIINNFVAQPVEQTDIIHNSEIKYKYIGSLFNTYIIIEIKDRMYIIDQHAAHERLLYERIKDNYYGRNRETQMLLLPILVELKNNEKEIAIRDREMFEKAGFVFEDFGDNAIKICGIPNVGYDLDSREMFMDGIDEIMGASKTVKTEKENRFLSTLACKSAIKGNMMVTKEEHIALLDDMMKLQNPFTCPHGRPTAYEISKYEIERKFLRK